MTDKTLDETSRYGSTRWVAKTLGMTVDTFRKKQDALTEAGFPDKDPIINHWIKADVEAWIEMRRSIVPTTVLKVETETKEEVNLHAL